MSRWMEGWRSFEWIEEWTSSAMHPLRRLWSARLCISEDADPYVDLGGES